MSLIKKIDVPAHFAARRASTGAGVQLTRQPLATGISESKTADIKSNAPGFIEDFSREHSSPGGAVTPIE
jgi:hypothetical protein